MAEFCKETPDTVGCKEKVAKGACTDQVGCKAKFYDDVAVCGNMDCAGCSFCKAGAGVPSMLEKENDGEEKAVRGVGSDCSATEWCARGVTCCFWDDATAAAGYDAGSGECRMKCAPSTRNEEDAPVYEPLGPTDSSARACDDNARALACIKSATKCSDTYKRCFFSSSLTSSGKSAAGVPGRAL